MEDTSTPLEIVNPFKEEVPASRLLKPEVPPSKHRAGRHRKMNDQEKRARRLRVRARIRAVLDKKAVDNAG